MQTPRAAFKRPSQCKGGVPYAALVFFPSGAYPIPGVPRSEIYSSRSTATRSKV